MNTELPPEQQSAWNKFEKAAYQELNNWNHTRGELVLVFKPSFSPPSYFNVHFSSGTIRWDFYYWDPSADFKRIFDSNEIMEQYPADGGSEIVMINTSKPWGIETTEGETIFEVDAAQVKIL